MYTNDIFVLRFWANKVLVLHVALDNQFHISYLFELSFSLSFFLSVTIFIYLHLQVSVIGYIPYFGKAMNILLLSLMYAYYCFEYVHLNVIRHSSYYFSKHCAFAILCN
jgi:hypothetical protein